MAGLLDRVEFRAGARVLKSSGVPLAMVWRRLEGGESPSQVAEGLAIVAGDLLAAIATVGLGDPLGLPLVRANSPRPALAKALEDRALAALLPASSRPSRLALAAGMLQSLDCWEASHAAAQEADDLGETGSAAYWHGIAHRREPDPGNAAYWFRRVGRHPLFAALNDAAAGLIRAEGGQVPSEATRLSRGDAWDPSAMIALCGVAKSGGPVEALARKIQRVEMALLLDVSATACGC